MELQLSYPFIQERVLECFKNTLAFWGVTYLCIFGAAALAICRLILLLVFFMQKFQTLVEMWVHFNIVQSFVSQAK